MSNHFAQHHLHFGAYYFTLEGDTIHCGRWGKLLFSCPPEELGPRLAHYLRVDEARIRTPPQPKVKLKINLIPPSQRTK